MLENSYPIRTDLALESQERLQEDQADMRGIRVLEERRENGVIVSTVMIETENASVAMGRPKGTYITIEAPEMIEEDAGYHRDISLELAKIMVEIGTRAGRHVSALLTGMDEPLGSHVGNRLEVKEAIDILRGESAGPLLTVSLRLGAQLLIASGIADTPEAGEALLEKALADGSGLEKLRQMIAAQGGDASVCDHPEVLAEAPVVRDVAAPCAGYIAHMDTAKLGYASQELGAGRKRKTDAIDPRVGFIMRCRVGDHLAAGAPLCTVYAAKEADFEKAQAMILDAITLSDTPAEKEKLLYALVTAEGVKTL